MKMELSFSIMLKIFFCLFFSFMISHNHGIVQATNKIIKSIYGERYRCVDFYKQQGFNHPSMKNHTFHYKMRMTSYPEEFKMEKDNKTFGHLWENGVGCPIGMVPQHIVTKEDLLSLNSFGGYDSKPRSSWNKPYEPMDSNVGHHFALIRTKGGPERYKGACMNLAMFTPSVTADQFSSARLLIQMGGDFIQAGWTINPKLYNYPDVQPRLFVFTKAGAEQCFNSLCSSGITLVREDIAPGVPLEGIDRDTDKNIALTKDKVNGFWWLSLNGEQVGYWPANLFKDGTGTGVEWGGEVYSPSFPSPPMGNGHFPVGNPNKDSYMRRLMIADGDYKTDDTVGNTERYSDNNHGYKVTDTTESWWRNFGHLVLYGGPGNI